MAAKKHNNDVTSGDIVGYSGSYGTRFYGYKLVKEVWVTAVSDYVWLAQYGTVDSENKFKANNDGENIQVLTADTIKTDYTEVWTPNPEFTKGDILVGTHESSGTRVVLHYVSDTHVERLTPYDGLGDTGWGSMAHYRGRLENITILTSSLTGQKHSEL